MIILYLLHADKQFIIFFFILLTITFQAVKLKLFSDTAITYSLYPVFFVYTQLIIYDYTNFICSYTTSFVCGDVTAEMIQFDVQFLILYSGLQSIKQVIF